MKSFNNASVVKYLAETSLKSEIYLGCDSQRKKYRDGWWAIYTVALVVHIEGCKGCKIFYITSKERDYDGKLHKPSMRLMNEVYKVAEAYQQIAELIDNRYFEIHLDINPNKMHGSNCVISQAVGYIRGVCLTEPKVKPLAWCASKAADHGARMKYDHAEVA